MQKHIRSKCHRCAASVLLTGIIAMAPAGIANAAAYKVTGHWDFDQGDLRATLGADLQYGDAPGETAMRDISIRANDIPPVVRMYGDGEADNEVNTVYVNSLQFREGTMTPEEALSLGAATANGLPIPLT